MPAGNRRSGVEHALDAEGSCPRAKDARNVSASVAPRLRAFLHMKAPATCVADIMTKTVRAIGTSATLEDAHALMRETGIHHLVVMKAGHVAGVLSSRDCERAHAAHFMSGDEAWTVEEMMTARVIVVAPETSIREAAAKLRVYAIGCLPVVDGKDLVGIVTISDLLDLLAEKAPRGPHKRGEPDDEATVRFRS
jgi:CBS domain-containing protein